MVYIIGLKNHQFIIFNIIYNLIMLGYETTDKIKQNILLILIILNSLIIHIINSLVISKC